MTIHFLTVADIEREQLDQLAVYGGGSPGVLNRGRVEAAVAAAENARYYVGDDLFALAAAYLQYLVLGHAFGNGNKRVSLAAALHFMFLNGVRIEADPEQMTRLVLDTTTHVVDKEGIAAFFREHAVNFPPPLADPPLAQPRADALHEAREWAHARYAETFRELAK